MKKLELYIKEEQLFDIVKLEMFESSNSNKKIADTDEYALYVGDHVFNRLYRHAMDTGNYGDKIKLNDVIKTVKSGFHHIENCYNNNRLKAGDSNSILCITNTKMNPALNVILFISSFNGIKYDIVIKTVMRKNAFRASLIRTVNEEFMCNVKFVEI